MLSINERSRLYFREIRLRNAVNQDQAPATLRYRVDCESTRLAIIDWTELAPSAVFDLLIPASANAIQNRSNDAELKTITVQCDEGTDNEINVPYTWRVKNLFGVS